MPVQNQPATRSARGGGVCVTARRGSSEAGAAMLKAGGNAFDAIVAAGFMEAVIAPESCGIGGYGASGIAYLARKDRLVALDADAVAPAEATSTMFPIIPGRDPNDFRFPDKRHRIGPLSVGVPGVLGGLLTLLEQWGSLDRKTVMAPAISRAREGVALSPGSAFGWAKMEAEAEGRAIPDRAKVQTIVTMPALADTLQAIAEEGPDVFYKGRIGKAIAEDVRRRGGILSPDDMATYRALVVAPVQVDAAGHTFATPPPASGGLTSLQMIALADRLHSAGPHIEPGTADAFERLLEIDKVVWEDRLQTLGDARTMARPPATFLAPDHLERLLAGVREGLKHPTPGRLIAPDPLRGTVHIAAADAQGNLVSWTQTHGGGYGSGVMVKGLGVVLGHGMCRFEPRPGWANSIAPGKRPLHNMCPMIVLRNGRPVLSIGATGGRTIVNNVATVAIHRVIHGLGPVESVAAARLQCESREPATLERSAGESVFETLQRRGHELKPTNKDAGTVHMIARDSDAWLAIPEVRHPTATAMSA